MRGETERGSRVLHACGCPPRAPARGSALEASASLFLKEEASAALQSHKSETRISATARQRHALTERELDDLYGPEPE
jgi:hypothetical protein